MPAVCATLLYTRMPSPVGDLLLAGDGDALHHVSMLDGPDPITPAASWQEAREPFADAVSQLDEYFIGQRTTFAVPLVMEGTAFQRQVWRALQEIPYGATVSYGELARRIGQPGASRAIGLANGRNPIAIIVPCHRVIGSDGTLTGYGGGLERKQLLLDLELRNRRSLLI